MADVTLYQKGDHDGAEYHLSGGSDDRKFMANFNGKEFDNGDELRNNITSVKVGRNAYLALYREEGYTGRAEYFLPNTNSTEIQNSNRIQSLKLWTIDPNDLDETETNVVKLQKMVSDAKHFLIAIRGE